jgi:beta-lactamase class A
MLTLLCLIAAVGGPAKTDSLATRIQERVRQVPGAEVGIAFHRLDSPSDTLYIDADRSMHAASTMKVPVMIELFRQVDSHGLSLDQKILLVNQFGSIVDGSLYSLNSSDDSDSSVYALVGQRVSVRDLMYHMITRSSNLATNALIALVGAKRTTAAMRSLGANEIQVLRGVEDEKAYERGMNNTTTARDLATIMEAIEENRAASPESCEAMRQILLHQEFNGEIPAGLPSGTPVAHKTGQITAHLHDAAIVYPRGAEPYVLVILTRGIPDEKVARSLMADISRMVYEHVMATSGKATSAPDHGTRNAGKL